VLDQAIRDGADLVGGLDPAGIDGDVTGQLDAIFAIAERHSIGVDVHLHDPGSLGCFELRQISERTIAAGLQRRVAVSHAFALGEVDEREFERTAETLARAGVAIMTSAPGPVAMPPIKRLCAAGVTVFGGSDNIRDAWSPYGNGDMLERATLIAYRQGFLADEDLALALSLVTEAPASVLGLDSFTRIFGSGSRHRPTTKSGQFGLRQNSAFTPDIFCIRAISARIWTAKPIPTVTRHGPRKIQTSGGSTRRWL
jgi:cytosine deaminase